MSLISRLGRRFREKPKSTNLNLPSLPSPREILEDIESCSSKDSIIPFANLIQKKGKQSLLDRDFLENDSSVASEAPLAFLSLYQSGSDENLLEDSQLHGRSGKRRGSINSGIQAASNSSSSSKKKPSEIEQINSYNQFKKFLLLYEKSEELLEDIEPYFKRMEVTLQSCESYSTSEAGATNCKDLEGDVCSSPLL